MIGAHFHHVVWVGVVILPWEQNGRGRRVKVVFDLAVHLVLDQYPHHSLYKALMYVKSCLSHSRRVCFAQLCDERGEKRDFGLGSFQHADVAPQNA